MSGIFVCYTRSDQSIVTNLVKRLRNVFGYDEVFFDADIRGGTEWWQHILQKIQACDVFVYLLSNRSLKSEYCQAECREAIDKNKLILPVIIRRHTNLNCAPDDIQQAIDAVQWLDLSGWRSPNTFEDALGAIWHLQGKENHASQTVSVGGDVRNSLLNVGGTQLFQGDVIINNHTTPPPTNDKKGWTDAATFWGPVVAAVIAGLFGLYGVFLTLGSDQPPPSPTSSQIPTQTEAATVLAETITSIPTAFSVNPILTVERGIESIAVSVDENMDLSSLIIHFGDNTEYILGNELPQSEDHIAGQWWCLILENQRATLPSNCQNSFRKEVERYSDSDRIWRNNPIRISLEQFTITSHCKKNSIGSEPYICQLELVPESS